jgi:RNA polymerase sigma-70 factor (ECF subfamily)
VITIRAALTVLRREQRSVPVDEHLWEVASPNCDPSLALLKRESAALIKAAFHAGLAALSPRQRNLLRQHLLDGLSIDELGAMYQIHRVTAARWLTAARSDLWAHTRRQLRHTLGLTDSAIGIMLDEIRSTLDLSIERALT